MVFILRGRHSRGVARSCGRYAGGMERLSRRAFVVKSASGAAGVLVLGGSGLAGRVEAKENAPKPDPLSDAEGLLFKPLSEEARKLARPSIEQTRAVTAARSSFKLPENSEPCFVFKPTKIMPKDKLR